MTTQQPLDHIPVLDKGFVEVLDVMGDDNAIVAAARVSFLGESKGPDRDKKLLFYLMRHDHGTPFEMVVFKFRVRAPEVAFRQWVRHRIGSFNVQSRRYTEVDETDYYHPPAWRMQSESNKQGSEGALDDVAAAQLDARLEEVYRACTAAYQDALAAGVARELARLFLPGFAVYSTFIWTVNARALMNFIRLRMAPDAQWEIQQYARALWGVFQARLPWTAEAFATYQLHKAE
ncbi:MAG: FAD-dependent thymidylate synthase [Anaerolineae bacterium]|nr:FAD-dependent thymidylate synthase [Anaerolineae bacterium]